MATITKGKTFVNGELVTPEKLHQLVDSATLSPLVNADIASNAAIADTKLAQISTAGKVLPAAVQGTAVITSDSRLSDARPPTTHNHDDRYYTETEMNNLLAGKQASGSYAPATGIAATAITGTAVITTDSRLSDARTPTSHTHGNLTNAGAIGATANLPVVTTTSGVLTTIPAGSAGQVLTSNGGTSAPSFQTLAATSTNANNLTGGSAGTVPYQSAAGTTAMLAAGTSGQVLRSNGAAAPSWLTLATSATTDTTNAGNITSGTLANARTTATSANTASAIVARDASGSFECGNILINDITAGKGAGNVSSNTVFGSGALASNTTGLGNTAIGRRSLEDNITGESCTAVGFESLLNSTGSYNTAIGRSALRLNTVGDLNTGLGEEALSNNTTFNNVTGVGYNSQVTGSNQVRLGNTSVTAVVSQVGSFSDERDKADIRDTVLGLDFIQQLRPVDYKWDFREDYRPALPEDATPEQLAAWSDEVKLANITHDGTHKRTRYHHGLIAQEVQAVIANTGVDFGGFQDHSIAGGDAAMTISYLELIGPLIKAVQELAARVAALEAK